MCWRRISGTEKEEWSGDSQPALVPWEDAAAYCVWVGGRLPTEGRGGRRRSAAPTGACGPWGNEFVELRANVSGAQDGYLGTAPVGSFPDDVSPFGLFDAAGNAGEWVSDWFDREYYASSPSHNPTGPASGDLKVHRAPIGARGRRPGESPVRGALRCGPKLG